MENPVRIGLALDDPRPTGSIPRLRQGLLYLLARIRRGAIERHAIIDVDLVPSHSILGRAKLRTSEKYSVTVRRSELLFSDSGYGDVIIGTKVKLN